MKSIQCFFVHKQKVQAYTPSAFCFLCFDAAPQTRVEGEKISTADQEHSVISEKEEEPQPAVIPKPAEGEDEEKHGQYARFTVINCFSA